MNLQSLLLNQPDSSKPIAFIITKTHCGYQAQKVEYYPEILNLGVILVGYYHNPKKAHQLTSLGNCLVVGHYLQAPSILKYGRDFNQNHDFLQLPIKIRKHLIEGIQDGTIALTRDFKQQSPLVSESNLENLIRILNSTNYLYCFYQNQWMIMVHHHFESLRDVIKQVLLRKEDLK